MNQCSNPFQIDSPKISIDSHVKKVLEELKHRLTKTKGNQVEILTQPRWKTQITKLSKRLDEKCLDNVTRLLLSQQEIYAITIYEAIGYDQDNEEQIQNKFDDIDNLYCQVLEKINNKINGIKLIFFSLLVGEIFDKKGYKVVDLSTSEKQLLDDLILAEDISIVAGKVEPSITKIWDEVTKKSMLDNSKSNPKSDAIIELINQIKISIEQVEKDLEDMSDNPQQTLDLQKVLQEIEEIKTTIKSLEDKNDKQQKAIDRLEQDNKNNKNRIAKLEENDQKNQKLIEVLSNINISVDGRLSEQKPDTVCCPPEPIPQSNKDAIIKLLGL